MEKKNNTKCVTVRVQEKEEKIDEWPFTWFRPCIKQKKNHRRRWHR